MGNKFVPFLVFCCLYLQIVVKVDDINDNTPVFESMSYAVKVREDLSVGGEIIKITARDADEGDNGTVKYIITNGQGTLRYINTIHYYIEYSGILSDINEIKALSQP